MKNRANTLENIMSVYLNIDSLPAIYDPSVALEMYLPKWKKAYIKVEIIHQSEDYKQMFVAPFSTKATSWKTTVSITSWMDRSNLVYSHNGILANNKKEENIHILKTQINIEIAWWKDEW